MPSPDALMTAREYALQAGLSPRTTQEWVTLGHVQASRIGQAWVATYQTWEDARLRRRPVGRPRKESMMTVTIPTATPDPPAWVTAHPSARHAWRQSLSWRADAARAQTDHWRAKLLADAERLYPGAR